MDSEVSFNIPENSEIDAAIPMMNGQTIGRFHLSNGIKKDGNDNIMKSEYEQNSKGYLPKRLSQEELFHTYTKQPHIVKKLVGSATSEMKRARLISKEGESNIKSENIVMRKHKFLKDFFTTLLDLKWRYTILVFALAFVSTWMFFALVYFVIVRVHQDHLHVDDPDWKPCVGNVYDFTTAFLFSLETQHTIGYGFRGMEPNCVPAMISLAIQSCMGTFFQCIATGLVFAKLSRPKRRSQTIMFSKKAVIVQRDSTLSLLFRVGDMRRTHIIATNIRAVLVRNRLTKEGELIPLCQYPLYLQTEQGKQDDSYLFLMWPVTISHPIDEESPLWEMSADDLDTQHFEIIVILEGTIATNGMAMQVRTSYLPSEILWGHRLAPLLTNKRDSGGYLIDHQEFHHTIPLDNMPLSSAKDLAKLPKRQSSQHSECGSIVSDFTTPSEYHTFHGSNSIKFQEMLGRRHSSFLPSLPTIKAG